MLDAVHEPTGDPYEAWRIWKKFDDPYKEKWICCPDCKHQVSPVKFHYRAVDGKMFGVGSHFRQRPEEFCQHGESDSHRNLKILVATLMEDKKINLTVYGQQIAWKDLQFKDVPKLKFRWEQSNGERRADVKFELEYFHPLLGKGIVFEIQLSEISEKEKLNREIDWCTNGWSLAWLDRDSFHPNEPRLTTNVLEITRPYHLGSIGACKNLLASIITEKEVLETRLAEIEGLVDNIQGSISALRDVPLELKEIVTQKLDTDFREMVVQKLNNLNDWTSRTCRTCGFGATNKKRDSSGRFTIETDLIACFYNYRFHRPHGKVTIHEPLDSCEKWKRKGGQNATN